MNARPLERLEIQSDPLADGLMRLLGVIAVQPVRLVAVRHDQGGDRALTIVDLTAVSPEKVALLVARLRQAPFVRSVERLTATASLSALACDSIPDDGSDLRRRSSRTAFAAAAAR